MTVPFGRAGGHGPPPDRRGVRAGARPLPAARPDRRARLLDRRRSSSTFIPWNLATLAGVTARRPDPRSARFGIDVIFPAAMVGLAVGLITGRRELVAAIVGACDRRRRRARLEPGDRDRRRRAARARWPGCSSRPRRPARPRRSGTETRPNATRCPGHVGDRAPSDRAADARGRRHRPSAAREHRARPAGGADGRRDLSVAGARPARRPGIDRLPPVALDYLQLVGPAVLARWPPSTSWSSWTRRAAAELPCRRRVARGDRLSSRSSRGARTCSSGSSPRSSLVADRASRWAWPRHAPDGRASPPQPRGASRPRSRRAGSARSARPTTTMVAAGRIVAEQLAVDGRAPGRDVPMSVTNIRVRTTSVRREPAVGEGRLDDRERRPAWAADIARVAAIDRPARHRSCRRPSTRRRRRPPGCSRRRLPRPAGRDQPALDRVTPGRPPARPRPGRGATASSSAGQQRRPRHDRVDLEVLGRRSGRCRRSARGRRGSARPCPEVVFASDAPPVAASADAKPSRAAIADGVLDEPAASARASPSATSAAIASTSTVVSGTVGRRGDRRGPRPRPPRGPSRLVARTSTSSARRSGHDVRPRPAARSRRRCTVTPGQRPLSAWRSRTIRGGLEDRAAALLRLDAGVGGPAVDREAQVDDALARRHDVAVRPGALEHEARVDVARPARGCAGSSSASRSPRPGWRRTTSRSNGSAAPRRRPTSSACSA